MFSHIFILIFVNCVINCLCFHVDFHEFYGAQLEPFNTQIQKREMQFFDKAAYSFNGLERIESVPVPFPIDICILLLDGIKYAASLHKNKNGERHFTIYKNLNQTYIEFYTIAMSNAIAMDCKTLGAKGYIALALNITEPIENAREGSPIYQLSSNDRLRAVQYFATTNLYSVYLRTTANDLFMLQTFQSNIGGRSSNSHLHCPYYKWSGTSFTLLGRIPCSNARHVEPFAISYENYIALANYADSNGRTTTYSEIYKFVEEKKRFQLVQKIRTYGAVDVRYFNAPLDEVKRRHFLVFGNSVSRKKSKVNQNVDADEVDSVFYIYDEGQFVPYQSLSLYAVEQFLPVQNTDAEKFILLVASKDQDIKIYNLNDWKFEPSNVQFTEGALGEGVSNMRIYQENDKSYLIIANEKMTENDTNIFMPIFKQDQHANALRQQIIDWTKVQIERLARIDINKLKKDVQKKLALNQRPNINMNVADIPKSNIQTVNTNAFVSQKYHFSEHYWKALHSATKAVNALEAEINLTASQRLRRATNTSSNANITDTDDPVEKFFNMNVGTLVVKDKLHTQLVNGVNSSNSTFDHVRAKQVSVTESTKLVIPTVAVKNLKINGLLNKLTWNDLQDYTLKHEGVQYLTQPVQMDSLVTDSVHVNNNEINGNNLNRLILTVDARNGSNETENRTYVINQSIRFEAPVKTKELIIHERLNQIYVHKNKLDVLLKRTNVTQVLESSKLFENVRILQPIAMTGQVLGSRLQSMSPQQIIHENLILNGDFTIKGDAIIFESLNVDDLIDTKSKLSTKQTLKNALDLTQTLEDVSIKFEHPLEANNTQVTFINGTDMQKLIKTNFKNIQLVEGEKHFNQSLEIQTGFCEVKYINEIDIETLPELLLLKSSDQSIKVTMELGKITTSNITAQKIMLKNKPLEAYLTRSKQDQHIPITLTVRNLSTQILNIENLYSKVNHILGQAITSKTPQKLELFNTSTKSINLLPLEKKFESTIYVGNLRLNDGDINGRNVHDITKQLQQLNADIHFEGNYKFNYNMNISHLTYSGKLNDISAREFGRSWLQKNGTQVFTAPQSLFKVNCLKGVQLNGTLNEHSIKDFNEKTYWINRNEYINLLEFKNPIQMQKALSTTTLNDIHIPLDIIKFNSSMPQILFTSATVHGNLNIMDTNRIYNISTLNGINLLELQQYLKAGNGDTLHVEHAKFAQTPFYHTLNGNTLSALLDKVWLDNESVRLSQHVEIADATFEGLMEFEGLVNNVNLFHLKNNYLSLSRPQEIGTELILTDEVKFEGELTVDDAHLSGLLVDNNSGSFTNFEDFVTNTMKADGPHEVRSRWSIKRGHIQGDLQNVQINNLNLANDIIRLDVPCTPSIAPKHLEALTIQQLYLTPRSMIDNVQMVNWLQNAVYVVGNHSINGNISLDTINMYNDLTVLGAVNNISHFGEETLLLRHIPQTLNGDVYINNLFVEDRRILVNNIENLYTKIVNKKEVNEFYEKLVKIWPNITVDGNLIFMQPLLIQNYHNLDVIENKSKRNATVIEDAVASYTNIIHMSNWKKMLKMVVKLNHLLKEPYYFRNHFAVQQTLPINASEIVQFKVIGESGRTMDVIGIVCDGDNSTNVLYYQWSIVSKRFEDIPWLPNEVAFIDALMLLKSYDPHIIVLNKTSASYLLSNLKPAYENLKKNKALRIYNEPCFTTKSSLENNSTSIYCLKDNFVPYKKYLIPRDDIREVTQVAFDRIAITLSYSIEIWRIQPTLEFVERLSISNSTEIVGSEMKNVTYLAIHTRNTTAGCHCGAVEIYRSINSTHLGSMQILKFSDLIKMSLMRITPAADLLLVILRSDNKAPLIIYQYRGVNGFEKLSEMTSLPTIRSFQILQLENATKQMIVFMLNDELRFVEIGLE